MAAPTDRIKRALRALKVILICLMAVSLAGLVLLGIAIFLGPPFWAWAIGFLAPLMVLALIGIISGIFSLIWDISENIARKREARRAAKAGNPPVPAPAQ